MRYVPAAEDAQDYRAFEATIIADYDAQSGVERAFTRFWLFTPTSKLPCRNGLSSCHGSRQRSLCQI